MDTCRACMAQNDRNEMIFLFEGAKVAEMFSKCTSLEASDVDGLPAHICLICHESLVGYNKFRLKCSASDAHFRHKTFATTVKIECNVPYDVDADEMIVMNEPTNPTVKYESNDTAEIDVKNCRGTRALITVEPDVKSVSNYAVKTEHNNDHDPIETLSDNEDADFDGGSIDDDDDDDDEDDDDELDEEDEDENKQELADEDYVQKRNKSTKKIRKSKRSLSSGDPERKPKKKKFRRPEGEPSSLNITCDICGKKFFKLHRLEGHLRQHQGLKACVCKVCGKEFSKWGGLSMHMRQVHGDESVKIKFSCDEEGCEKSYNLKQTLMSHKRRVHCTNPEDQPTSTFVCDMCGKLFKTKASLTKHSYTHTGLMPFKCSLCPKKYATKHKLKEHTMRHEGVKNHICPICGLRKTTPHELKVHMNYHTREKLYPCKLCPSVFSSIGNMSRHVRIVHCGVKAYNCTYCDRSFGKAETLKHHVMTHTGEKPHECNVCGKRFIQSIALQTHMKTHKKIAPISGEAPIFNLP